MATSRELLAFSYPAALTTNGLAEPRREVLLQLPAPSGTSSGNRPAGPGEGHAILAVQAIRRSYQSPLIVLLVREAVDTAPSSSAAGASATTRALQPPGPGRGGGGNVNGGILYFCFTFQPRPDHILTLRTHRRSNSAGAGFTRSDDPASTGGTVAASYALHVFGFGCPADASLQVLCRHQLFVQLGYPARMLAELSGIAGSAEHGLLVGGLDGSLHTYAVVSGSVQRGQGGTLKQERNAFLGSLHRIPALRMRAAVLTLDAIVLPETGDSVLMLGLACGTLLLFRLKGGLPVPTPPQCRQTMCDGAISSVKLWLSEDTVAAEDQDGRADDSLAALAQRLAVVPAVAPRTPTVSAAEEPAVADAGDGGEYTINPHLNLTTMRASERCASQLGLVGVERMARRRLLLTHLPRRWRRRSKPRSGSHQAQTYQA